MLQRVVYGLLALIFFLLPAGALLLIGQAGAQVVGDAPPGIPAEYGTLVTMGIAVLSAVLVQPLTAIAKKLGRTTGPNTVLVSAVLSLLVAFGFAYSQAQASGQDLPVLSTLFIALVAFAKANGDYINRVFTTAKGNELAPTTPAAPAVVVNPPPVVIGELAPPAGTITPPSGLEMIPGLDGPPIEARGLMGEAVLELGLGMLVEQMLKQARLPATADQVARVVARLAVVAPDLLDGDAHLNHENRNRVLGAIIDLKATGGLL